MHLSVLILVYKNGASSFCRNLELTFLRYRQEIRIAKLLSILVEIPQLVPAISIGESSVLRVSEGNALARLTFTIRLATVAAYWLDLHR